MAYRYRVGVVGLVVLLTFAAAQTTGAFDLGNGPTLASVSTQGLASHAIYLGQPASQAILGQDAAVTTALAQFPGSHVRETLLAQVTDTRVPVINGRLCWIVSIVPSTGIVMPSAGPDGHTPIYGDYFLVFVDAKSGTYLFGAIGQGH